MRSKKLDEISKVLTKDLILDICNKVFPENYFITVDKLNDDDVKEYPFTITAKTIFNHNLLVFVYYVNTKLIKNAKNVEGYITHCANEMLKDMENTMKKEV